MLKVPPCVCRSAGSGFFHLLLRAVNQICPLAVVLPVQQGGCEGRGVPRLGQASPGWDGRPPQPLIRSLSGVGVPGGPEAVLEALPRTHDQQPVQLSSLPSHLQDPGQGGTSSQVGDFTPSLPRLPSSLPFRPSGPRMSCRSPPPSSWVTRRRSSPSWRCWDSTRTRLRPLPATTTHNRVRADHMTRD